MFADRGRVSTPKIHCNTLSSLHSFLRATSPLIEVDGENQNGPNCNVLPERLHTGYHEPIT